MSRLAKNPIKIPANVKFYSSKVGFIAEGPKGSVSHPFFDEISVDLSENFIQISPTTNSSHSLSMSGTAASIIKSMILGVTEGFEKSLELFGVGFKASLSNDNDYIILLLGKSHSDMFKIPTGISVRIENQNTIFLTSCDKQLLGQCVAHLKKQRKVELYKGKGIREKGEVILLKEGKKG